MNVLHRTDIALAADIESIEGCRAIWADVTGRVPRGFRMPAWLFERIAGYAAKDLPIMWRCPSDINSPDDRARAAGPGPDRADRRSCVPTVKMSAPSMPAPRAEVAQSIELLEDAALVGLLVPGPGVRRTRTAMLPARAEAEEGRGG